MQGMDWQRVLKLGGTVEGRLELRLFAITSGLQYGQRKYWDLSDLQKRIEAKTGYERRDEIKLARRCFRYLFSVAKAHEKGMLTERQVQKYAEILRMVEPFEDFYRSVGVRLRYAEMPATIRLRERHEEQ